MKFALNGALTIGTLDGANVEMREHVGRRTSLSSAIPPNRWRSCAATATTRINTTSRIPSCTGADADRHRRLQPGRTEALQQPVRLVGEHGDHYQLLADYRSYVDTQDKVDEVYLNQDEWTRRAVLNIANMGYFSSDRTIQEYADEIWHIQPVKL